MPLTTGIRQQSGNPIPEQLESRARVDDGSKNAALGHTSTHIDPITVATPVNDVDHVARAGTGNTPAAAASRAAACRAPDTGATGALRHPLRAAPVEATAARDVDLDHVKEVDRPLVDAMGFFDAPDAEPPLPFEQMIYAPLDETYTFRAFPALPVMPRSHRERWRAVQLNLTHDGALGAALAALACRPEALARVLRPGSRPGWYVVTLQLPAATGELLAVQTVVDARVPATESGQVLGRVDKEADAALWPLVVAKGIGKLVRVLRASGHLPAYSDKPALPYTRFQTWLSGSEPVGTTDVGQVAMERGAANAPSAVQVPGAAGGKISLPGGTAAPALGGMAYRLRSHSGHIDVLLLAGHHYAVVGGDKKHVTLYNPLGFNPHPALADTPESAFFDPHSLSSSGTVAGTITLPSSWLRTLGSIWFMQR